MKSFLISIAILLSSSFAQAGTFCVGNFAGDTLAWSVSDKNVKVYETFEHGLDQQWMCAEVEDGKPYEVEVANAERMDTEPACVFPVKSGEWVLAREITTPTAVALQCAHMGPSGEMKDGKERIMGSTRPFSLNGFANVDGPLAGAQVSLRDRTGKIVGTAKTGKLGSFEIKLKYADVDGARLETRGGTVNGVAFDGTMGADLDDEFQVRTDFAYINIGSTLVAAAHAKYKDRSIASIEAQVRKYLGLGESVDLQITQSSLEVFSAKTFMAQAKAVGGFNKLVQSIKSDLDNPELVRPFRGQKLLKFVAKAIAAGIVEKTAYVVWGKALAEMGLADPGTLALKKLEEISQQLAQINSRLDDLKLQITELNYSTRVQTINSCYGNILREVKSLAAKNQAVIDRGSKPADIADLNLKKEATAVKVMEMAPNCYSEINSQLEPKVKGIEPIQKIWAEAAYQKEGAIIRPQYFKDVDDHIGSLNIIQAYIAKLMIDYYGAQGNTDDAEQIRSDTLNWQNTSQVRILPKAFPMDVPEVHKAVEDNQGFAQKSPRRLWNYSIQFYPRIEEFRSHQYGKYKPFNAYIKEIQEVVVQTGTGHLTMENAMVNWGFPPATASAIKMIFVQAEMVAFYGNFMWIGNDRSGLVDPYWDAPASFYGVMNSKGMKPGLYSLSYFNY